MSDAGPSLSVVMPCYNERATIDEITTRVLASPHTRELLIVDDGSTDGTRSLLAAYDDPRIRIITQENRGLAGARNAGLREAVGDYVALLDSDDLWAPTKLEEHVRHLERDPGVGVSYSHSVFIDHEGLPLGFVRRPKLHDVDAKDIFIRDPLHPSAPVMRWMVLEEVGFTDTRRQVRETAYFDEDLRRCEDLEFWLRIALTTDWRFEGIPRPLSYLRINPGGLSSDLDAMMESWELCVEKVRAYAPDFVSRWEARARAYQRRFLARRAVRNGEGPEALRLAVGAVGESPSMLVREPGTSAATLGAALAMTVLPRRAYESLEKVGFRLLGGYQRHSR